MIKINTATKPDKLASWGTVDNLGSEILEGACEIAGQMLFGAPTDPISCAYFSVTKGKFRMVYPFNEHATVVEGHVKLTDERTGETQTFGPGDSWFIEKGTPVLWEVTGDRFTKNYLAVA